MALIVPDFTIIKKSSIKPTSKPTFHDLIMSLIFDNQKDNQMSKRNFIRENRTEIDEWIRMDYGLSSINDADREMYIKGNLDWKIKATSEGANFS